MNNLHYKARNIITQLKLANRPSNEPIEAPNVDNNPEGMEGEIFEKVLGGKEGLARIMKRELERFRRNQPKKWRNWLKSVSK